MIIQIEITFVDGTQMIVTSDTHSGWTVNSNGPITSNSIYDGERYDARLEMLGWNTPEFDIYESAAKGQEWRPAISVEEPGGKLVSQTMEPIKVVMDLEPVKLSNPSPGVYVYDFGQNISGWVRLDVEGPRDTVVTMKFSELIYENGTINRENLRTAEAADTYILKGSGIEVYEPRFTYHGFRYVQIEGFPGEPKLDTVLARVVRSAVETTGSFKCSNELINRIQNCAVWTEADNLMGVPTDCPQRDERLGWLNDATVRTEEAFYNFKLINLFKKWEQDIADTQGKNTGVIADTAPFYRFGRKPADPVCISYLIIPWLTYLYYGDKKVLEVNYEGMKKWVEYLSDNSEDYITTYSTYGDWASPLTQSVEGSAGAGAISAKTPGELMSTGFYYYSAFLMSKIAEVLGFKADGKHFEQLADFIKEAFNKKFLNKEQSYYATNNQASNVFPLYLGIVPEEHKQAVINHIVKDVMENNNGHLTTGNLCSRYIMDVLTEAGRIDVAYTLATQTTYPSWGYMIENGATTIWERWEYVTTGELCAMASHNHPMYASISAWFYKMLAGINVSEKGAGFKEIIIKPYIPEELDFVEASIKTVRGVIKSNWTKTQDGISMNISVPFNCSALIYVPVKDKTKSVILEGADVIWNSIKFEASSEDNYVVLKVESGTYSFKSINN
jgi:alpha-L-rhamnosidase